MRDDMKVVNDSIQGLRDSRDAINKRLARLEEYVSTLEETPKRESSEKGTNVWIYQCVGCCARLKVTFDSDTLEKETRCCFCETWQRVVAPDISRLPTAGCFQYS